MTISDILSIVAIIFGPVVAVVITRLMDDRNAAKGRRYQVFRDLMRTRAAKLSPAHVDALNLVEIEFNKFPRVTGAWHRYMENLAAANPIDENERSNFNVRREQLFIKLIQEVAKQSGLRTVDITDVMTSNYYPVGWQTEQQEQQQIRQSLIQVLAGNRPLSIKAFDNTKWAGPYPPAVPPAPMSPSKHSR